MKKSSFVVLLVFIVMSCSHGCAPVKSYTCDICDEPFILDVYYGMGGNEILCGDCARVYWLPMDYRNYQYDKAPTQSGVSTQDTSVFSDMPDMSESTEELQAYQEQPASATAAPFVPDYRPGRQHTQSIIGRRSFSDYGWPWLILQDRTFYYYNDNSWRICKFSFDDNGVLGEPIEVYFNSERIRMLSPQVVGDWIYFIRPRNELCELYRVRTDGAVVELITDQIPYYEQGCLYAIGEDNAVYFPSFWSTQSSASEYTYYSGFCRLQLDKPGAEPETIFSEQVRNEYDGLTLITFSDGMFVLERAGSSVYAERIFYLYYVGDNAPTIAPAWITDFVFFYPQQDGSLLAYTNSRQYRVMDTLHLVWPSDPQNPIFIMESPKKPDSEDKDPLISMCMDGDVLYYSLADTYHRGTDDQHEGLYRFDGSGSYRLNRDVPQTISVPGDGYIYYDYWGSGTNLYRVRLDGTGWEEIHY